MVYVHITPFLLLMAILDLACRPWRAALYKTSVAPISAIQYHTKLHPCSAAYLHLIPFKMQFRNVLLFAITAMTAVATPTPQM
jgi:hypothetical protein